MTIHTIQVVEFDDPPVTWNGKDNPEYAGLAEPFAAGLQDLIDNPDDRSCETCRKGIGYVVTNDGHDGDTMRWRWATLIAGPAGVVVGLCEECAPPLYLLTPPPKDH